MRFPCGAGLADLDAEVDEAPDSRLDPEPPEDGWPAVVRYAIDSTSRTVRFCAIVLVAGVVLLLAVLLGLRLWV